MKKNKNKVFYISLVIVALIAFFGIVFPNQFGEVGASVLDFLTTKFGWFYLLSMFAFVLFVFGIAFSKYGKVVLGKDGDKPEYSNITWFAMLFSAGMGIGLVFYGVSEPISHFMKPIEGIVPGSPEAANFALFSSFMHWGIHPWASYTIIALPLAYMQFRKDKPGLISSLLIPLIGEEKAKGPMGHIIDILAIFATVAGVATSLGLGVLQINSGLNFLFGIPNNNLFALITIVLLTIIFVWTAVAGIEKGISKVSNLNIIVAGGLMLLLFIIGPKIKILNSLVNTMGNYISGVVRESLKIDPFGDNTWINGWRIFYWAWWIAWAPFVGIFIARISKGRTIREFVTGVTTIPALGSFVWFAIFGTTAISQGTEVAAKAVKSTETALFVVFKQLPLGILMSIISIVLLYTFFITSANSATFVLGMLSENGDLNPSNKTKILWGVIQSALAYALLLAGGLQMLQTASITVAFPFAIIMILVMVSFMKVLRQEKK